MKFKLGILFIGTICYMHMQWWPLFILLGQLWRRQQFTLVFGDKYISLVNWYPLACDG